MPSSLLKSRIQANDNTGIETKVAGAIARGDLRAMSLPSIIQTNCGERNQARLVLRRDSEVGTMYFADGDVVHASVGALVGEEAVFQLLQWDRGEFELEMDASAPERNTALSGSALLLEGLRRLDEGTVGLDPEPLAIEAEIKDNDPDSNTRITKALRAIAGAQGAIICSQDGKVLAQELDGDASKPAALAAFVRNRAEVLGRYLRSGALLRIVFSGDGKLTTIVAQGENDVVLLTDPRSSPEAVANEIETIVRRYAG